MKFHKIILRTIIATIFLGVIFGGFTSDVNVSAQDNTSGQSNGSVPINDGSLTLDSVPNFNFADNTNSAQSNTSTNLQLANTGTNQLKITDYRNKNNNSNDKSKANTRWALSVQADPFSSTQGNSNDSNNWIINFTGQKSNNIQDNANTTIDSKQLVTNNSNGSNSQQIISNGQYGISEFDFNNNSVNLSAPNVKPGSSYTTTMNWSIKADPRSEDN